MTGGVRVENTVRVLLRMDRMSPTAEQEVSSELDVLAAMLGRRMTANAPKHRSLLGLSVRIQSPEKLTRDVGPTASYAAAQEEGVKPGGKGLPKYEDAQAADVIAWLRSHVRGKARTPRKGSAAAVREALQVRDRYEALAWWIRHHGVKATHFMRRSFDQLVPTLQVRLIDSIERAIQRGAQA